MSQTRWSRPYCRKSWADGHQLLSLLTTTMIETDFGERFIKTNNVIIFQLTFTLYFCQITVHFFTFLCSPYLSFEHMQVEKKPHCERSCCCSDTHYKIDHRTGVPNSVPGVKPAPWTMRNNVWPLTIFDLGFIFLGVSFANVLYSGPPRHQPQFNDLNICFLSSIHLNTTHFVSVFVFVFVSCKDHSGDWCSTSVQSVVMQQQAGIGDREAVTVMANFPQRMKTTLTPFTLYWLKS